MGAPRQRPGRADAEGARVPLILPIILLAAASTVRPTSLAAIYALLDRGRPPSRLLIAYVIAGIVFTIAFGVIVISTFGSVQLHSGSHRTKAIAEIAGGLLAIGVGIGVLTGRIGRREPVDPQPGRFERWRQVLDRRITMRTAAVAGPATHLPGLLYLLALDLIVASRAGLAPSVIYVLVFNGIWFALPIAALAVAIVNPVYARELIGDFQAWTRRHARGLILWISFTTGAIFLVAGLLTA